MAEGENERTSFVNETFDDLDSEPSDLLMNEEYEEKKKQERVEKDESVISKVNSEITLEKEEEGLDVRQRDDTQGKEELLASPQNNEYSYLEDIQALILTKETTPPSHHYDTPTSSKYDTPTIEDTPTYDAPILPHYDEPIIHDTKPHPPSRPPPKLASEDTPILSFEQRNEPSLSTSKVVAHSNSSHDDDTNHRPLPFPTLGKYDTIRDPLRGGNSSENSNFDLQVNITAREKHTLPKTDSYISYKIETISLRPRHLYEQSEYLVWRRYKDFEWLHGQLERNHPTLILPPLPGKQIMRYFDHMSETFLEERQRCLDQFLWRIVSHPFFSYDNNLKMFLTADDEAFTAHVQDSAAGNNNKLLGMVSTSVKHATTSIRLKNPDEGFVENSKYFANFSDKMGVLERIESRIETERKELSDEIKEMSQVTNTWSNSEPQLQEGIRKVSGSFEALSSALESLSDSNAYSFQLALKMYQNYASSAVSALKRRDVLQLEHEVAIEERDKKKKLHEDAVNVGKTEKVTKIASDLEKVGVTAEHTQDKLAQSNEQLRVDIEKWKDAKDDELRSILFNWSTNQIQFHEKMFHEWEETLLLLRQLGSDSDFIEQY